MRRVPLEDWKIKDKESPKNYLTKCVFESDNSKYAFYFTNIVEWSIYKYKASLTIYKDKTKPVEIFKSNPVVFLIDIFGLNKNYATEKQRYIYDWTDINLLCLRQLINHGNNKYSYPLIVLNFEKLEFSVIEDDTASIERTDYSKIFKITKQKRNFKMYYDANKGWIDASEYDKVSECLKYNDFKWMSFKQFVKLRSFV
jgi:hypothetical protein